MKKTRLLLELILYFDSFVNLKQIAERIPVIPCEIKNKIDRNKCSNSDDNLEGFLRYSTGYLESIDLEDVSSRLLKLVLPAIEEIQIILKQYNGQARFDIVVEVGKIKPSLFLNRQLLLLVERLEADVDIDMYVL